MRRRLPQRAAACLLALLVQAGLITLLLQSRPRQLALENDARHLVFILPSQLLQPPTPPPRRPPPREDSRAAEATVRSFPDQTPTQPVATTGPSVLPILPSPSPPADGTDWHAVMESAAREAVARMEERELHGDPLDSKPDVMVIPERPHRAGDTQHYPDGTVLTWLNETCYELRDPHSASSGSAKPGAVPPKVCKEKTLSQRRAEAYRKEREQAMVPEYIRRPVPKPRPAQPVP